MRIRLVIIAVLLVVVIAIGVILIPVLLQGFKQPHVNQLYQG